MTTGDESKKIFPPVIFFTLWLLLSITLAQQYDYERLLELEQENDEEGELVEYLEWRRAHPLDVNRATIVELQSLPWLTSTMAQEIVNLRKKRGEFSSLEELSDLCGWDEELLQSLAPYITCRSSRPSFYRFEARQRLSRRRQLSQGFINAAYKGDPNKIYQRLRFDWQHQLQLGVMTEKDPGEAELNDLTRAYLAFAMPKWHSELILGNFSLESGQGMIYAPTFQIGRSFDPISSEGRASTGLRPNLSTSEYGGYGGIALRCHWQTMEGIVFFSRDRWDANVDKDTVRSMLITGLHRTASERGRKGQVITRSYGLSFSRLFSDCFRLAVVLRSDKFSAIFGKSEQLQDRYDFSGRRYWAASWQWDFYRRPWHIFSEWGWNHLRASAYKIGLRLQEKRRSFLLSWRHNSPSFNDPRAKWSSEYTNHDALYFAAVGKIVSQLQITAYGEYSRNRWPRYQLPMPAFSQIEYMVGMTYQPQKVVDILVRLKYHHRYQSENYSDLFGNEIKMLTAHSRWHLVGQLDYSQKNISLRTRGEFKLKEERLDSPLWPTMPDSSGMLFYQQLRYQPLPWLTITGRYGLFDAPCYENRFYCYEQDLPGVWRSKMLYHRGLRWFLLCTFRPRHWLQASLKWEETLYDDKTFYGSGLDRVNSRRENIISVQLDWQWSHR